MRFQTLARLGLLPVALAIVAWAPSAQAQTVLTPGHPDLMTADLALDGQMMAARVLGDSPQDAGTMTTTVSRDGGTVTMVSKNNAQMIGRMGEVTTTFAWPSLRPIMRQPADSDNMTQYDGARVTGTWGNGDWDPLPYDITLASAPFQPEVLPFVARALPFRAGYTATVPTFTASGRLKDHLMTVVGQETFTRRDGSTVSAWVVEDSTFGRGGGTNRFHVDAASRDLVAVTFSMRGADVAIEPTTQEAIDAAAQARSMMMSLRPGSDALAVDALRSYTQSYTIKLVQPQQQDIGTQSRMVTVDRQAGTVTIVDSTEIAMAGQKNSSTTVLAYPSLRGVSSRSETGDVVTDLTYNDDGVIRRRTPADEESPDYERTFEEPVFDPSALFEVARLVPFEQDWTATYQTFNAEGLAGIVMTVTGQDEIEGRDVWLVEAAPDGAPATEFAVDAETRDLVRVKIRPQMGVEVHIVRAD